MGVETRRRYVTSFGRSPNTSLASTANAAAYTRASAGSCVLACCQNGDASSGFSSSRSWCATRVMNCSASSASIAFPATWIAAKSSANSKHVPRFSQ